MFSNLIFMLQSHIYVRNDTENVARQRETKTTYQHVLSKTETIILRCGYFRKLFLYSLYAQDTLCVDGHRLYDLRLYMHKYSKKSTYKRCGGAVW